jgi:tRNA threonylcarbamoyladenosine biosynthesis protein TsaB
MNEPKNGLFSAINEYSGSMQRPHNTIKDPDIAPLILTLETSGRTGSVALALGPSLIAEKPFSAAMRHSAELFTAISVLLDAAARNASHIHEVYISAGPGSFTGLRIAASVAKAMHLAGGVRVVAVPTLDVIAANAADYEAASHSRIPRIGVILDAKRGHFFIAAFENFAKAPDDFAQFARFLPDSVMTPEQFLDAVRPDNEPIWLLGEGLVYYRDKFAVEGVRFLPEDYWNPRASKVHLLGWQKSRRREYEDPLAFAPAYIARPDVRVKNQPSHS